MAVIYPYFLNHILKIHDNIQNQIPYPFFDKACILYEALRSVLVDGNDMQEILQDYGLTDYAYQKSFSAFMCYGVCGLIGIDSKLIIEELPVPGR
jgi:hypothetical protein